MPDFAEHLDASRAKALRQYDEGVAEYHLLHDLDDTRHLAAEAIRVCTLCDSDGYRPNGLVCDHVDRTETNRAGIQRARDALKGRQP